MEAVIGNESYSLIFRDNRLDEINLAGLGTVAKYDGDLVVNQMHTWAGFPSIMGLGQPDSVTVAGDTVLIASSNVFLPWNAQYWLQGDKLAITVEIENQTSQTLRAWRFTLPAFQFASMPQSLFAHCPINQLTNFTGHYYPGAARPIGAEWFSDGAMSIAIWSEDDPTHRSMFWLRSDYGTDPKRPLWHIDLEPIEPGRTIERTFYLRIKPGFHEPESMLEEFRLSMPAQTAQTTVMPFAHYFYSNEADPTLSTPQNKFGWKNPAIRFDDAQATADYAALLSQQCQRLNITDGIFWTFGSNHVQRRLAALNIHAYAEDAADVEDEIESNLELLRSSSPNYGRLVRLDYFFCATPSDDKTSLDLAYNRLHDNDPAYLDSTGFEANSREAELIHYKLIKRLRESGLPSMRWFCEWPFDRLLSYAGGFNFLQKQPYDVVRWRGRVWRLLRWLQPEALWIGHFADSGDVEPERRITWDQVNELKAAAEAMNVIGLLPVLRLSEVVV